MLISGGSLVEFLGSLIYNIISSVNSDPLTSTFLVCVPLISFCYLSALARTSSTILKRIRGSEQPCLVPDFSGTTVVFSPFT